MNYTLTDVIARNRIDGGMHGHQFGGGSGMSSGIGMGFHVARMIPALILTILLIILIIYLIRHLRTSRTYTNGKGIGRHTIPPSRMPEMTREQAARIMIAFWRSEGLGNIGIKEKLIREYDMDPLITEALIVAMSD